MRADPEIANGSQSLDARVHHGDGAGLASETVVPSRRWAAGIFVPSECIAVANPLQPDPRHDKSKGNGEMRGFFAPLRMTDTLTHPCRNATRVGWWVVVKRAAFGFASPYCAGLGSAFFAMAVGLGFQKVGSA